MCWGLHAWASPRVLAVEDAFLERIAGVAVVAPQLGLVVAATVSTRQAVGGHILADAADAVAVVAAIIEAVVERCRAPAARVPVVAGCGAMLTRQAISKVNQAMEAGCDAVMIARGCLGNPWIFKAIQNRIKGLPANNITVKDRLDICKHHLQLLRQNKNENLALNLTKKHFSWYLKGFNNAVSWRTKFLRSQSHDEVDTIMNDFELFIKEEETHLFE